METLRLALENNTAMTVGALRTSAVAWRAHPDFLPTAAEICVGADISIQHLGCTLLCDALKEGLPLDEATRAILENNLDGARDWRAQLGLCQIFAHPAANPRFDADAVGEFLLPLTQANNAFVRAWATSALAVTAAREPRFAADANAAIDRCRTDPSKAVQARMKKVPRLKT